MRIHSAFLAVILSSFLAQEAKPAKNNQGLSSDQKRFIKAEKALKKGDINQYNTLKQQLSHYSLLPYLEYQELVKSLSLSSKSKVDAFTQRYPHSPLPARLHSRFRNVLINKQQFSAVKPYHSFGKNAEMDCKIYLNQLNNGVSIETLASKIRTLWVVPKSQPKACDPVFARWKKAGYQNQKVIYERYYATAHSGSISLLNYLATLLPKKQQYINDMWVKAKKNPGVIARTRFFKGKDPNLEAPILVFAMKKLAWGNRDNAYHTWLKVQKRIPLSNAHKRDAERTLYLALATENHPKALDWTKRLLDKHLEDDLVSQWKLATLLRNNSWDELEELFLLLPKAQSSTIKWRYWYAVTLAELKRTAESEPLLKALAQERDYYGYLAATRLKLPLQLGHKSLIIPAKTEQSVRAMSNIERVKELWALERYNDASREWRSLLKRFNHKDQYKIAAKIAHEMEWFNQAIITVAKAKDWDDTDIRFPTAFTQDYISMAKKVGLPAQWLMGVSRQESAYGPLAISGAGAYGLMQVLPATAKVYAKKFNIPYKNRKDLLKPAINIPMGSHYLKLRYDELGNNPIYASAAYNAGKHRITKWVDFGRFPTDVWIESIPYTETRDYIKKVMTYRAIYALKLGVPDSTFEYILSTETGQEQFSAKP